MKKTILTSILAVLGLVSLNATAQVTSNFQATATVTSKCIVSSENINFGNLDLFSSSIVATGNVRVLCSNGVIYSVTPDYGWEDGRIQAIHNQNNQNDSAIVVLLDKASGQVWSRTNGFTATGNGQEQTHAISAEYRNNLQAKSYLGYIDNQYNYQATPGEYSGGVNVIVTY